jgi:DNA-directed RNA polymerase specialized sigma subunit
MLDAKAYLRKIELLDAHINNRLNDLHTLRTLATKITATISTVAVTGSSGQDKLGDAVAKIVDLQEEINQKIDRFVDMKREISMVLEKVKDPDQVKVLHKRYFEYKPWERIACEMNYSFRNVCYIHGKALQAVQEILEGGADNGEG